MEELPDEQIIKKNQALQQRIAELEQTVQHLEQTVATLQQREHDLTDLLNVSNDWVWEVDEQGRYTYVSDTVHDFLGYEPMELLGTTPFEMMTPEEAQRVAALFGAIVETQRAFKALENTILHKDGYPVVVETSGIPIFDHNGIFRGYRGVDSDINRHKKIEQSLRQSEKNLKAAQRIAHIGNWSWDIPSSTVTWTDEVYRILGWEPQQVESTLEIFIEVIHPDDREAVNRAIQQSLEEGTPYAVQHRVVWPNGEERFLQELGEVTYDSNGTPINMFGTMQDITERVRIQEAIQHMNTELEEQVAAQTEELRQSRNLLQTILNTLPQVIFWKNRDLVYQGCNQAFATLIGFEDTANVIGKTDYDMPWREEEAQFFRQIDSRIMETQNAEYHIIAPLRRADGKQAWADTSKVPILDDHGQVVGVVGTLEDITERRQNEEYLHIFKTIVENAPEAIGYADANGIMVYANKMHHSLFGYGDEILGQHLSVLIPPEAQTILQEAMPLISQGKSWSSESINCRKDGSIVPVDVLVFAIDGIDGHKNIVGFTRDITQRKEEEEQYRLLKQQIIDAQQAALLELSAPLLPISEKVVVLPLVGSIDTRRAQQIMETLLEGVAQNQADIAIVDITGVKIVDTQVANALVQAAQAVQLLGAQVVLTGIGPAMAQTLVHLGADLSGIVTRSNLQAGIAYAI